MAIRRRALALLVGLLVLSMFGTARPAEEKKRGKEAHDPNDLASYDAAIKPSDREHWSFQAVKKPALPKVRNDKWVRNPIDAFVLAGLEAEGWQPASAAAAHVLLRRVYLDLIGL